jgi:hypothetical protein
MQRLHLAAFAIALVCCTAACGDNKTHLPPDYNGYDSGTGSLPCVPNLDGTIDATELQAAFGAGANYLVSPAGIDRNVDLVGAVVGGQRRWELSLDYADDALVTLGASPLTGKWYASSFPTADFTAPFDAGKTLDGVYRHDDAALWLLGLASVDENPTEGKTLFVYDTPIPIVRFPLTAGANWVAAGTITNGTIKGLPYAGKDVYEIEDEETGTLVVPAFTLTQAHKVRTHVTVSPAVGTPTSQRQVSFFYECLGEVARATSKPGETDPDFSDAMELRRVAVRPSN